MKKLLFITLLGTIISACSTTSTSYSSASTSTPLSPPNTAHKVTGKARITFIRNLNDHKLPIVTAVSIDEWVVATLGPGEKTTLAVEAGLRQVGLKGKITPMTLKPSREYFFYIELNSEGTQYELRSILESKTKRLRNS